MKALTLHQPWATAIAVGLKTIETRSWGTDYRGPLAIHAGKERKYINPRSKYYLLNRYPFIHPLLLGRHLSLGCIVAMCDLVDCARIPLTIDRLWIKTPAGRHVPVPPFGDEFYFGNYSEGRYAWILENIQPLPEPIPAKGAQGLWEWRR